MSWGPRAPHEIIEAAIKALSRIGQVVARSQLYRSQAWPVATDPSFINAAIRYESDIDAEALLGSLQGIEAGFGRRKGPPNAPRTLDLDLLDFNGLVREGSARTLALPHPRLHQRDFVLAPLCDIAPSWTHPTLKTSAAQLLARLGGGAAVPLSSAGQL